METENMRADEAGGASVRTSSIGRRTFNLEWTMRTLDVAILLLAAFLRLAWLGLRPPHFDEGVNGWFVDGMTATGYYHYEPTNFHGPLHFYVLFAAQTLLGRSIEMLRLPLALASVGVVAFALFGWRRFFPASVCRLAALALAVSPAMVFFGRYAIHETWLVLFEMLLAWGILGLWCHGTRRDLWAAALGGAGMVLTKETWIVHAAALGLALLVFSVRKGELTVVLARQSWKLTDVARAGVVCVAVVGFFYSGCLLDPAGLTGLGETYHAWIGTGTDTEGGHVKPWFYWLQLLSWSEWPALLGVAASIGLVLSPANSPARFLTMVGAATLAAYSAIAYKTPWCVISIAWPFFFAFGAAVRKVTAAVDPWSGGSLAAVVLGCSLFQCATLNCQRYAPSLEQDDYAEPYVYVQTRREISKMLDPLRWLTARDPMALHRRGHLLQPEHHPFLWVLGDYTHITWDGADGEPELMDADWLLVDETAVDRVEAALRNRYFKTSLQLRGMAPDRSMLYLDADTFRDFFPDREPEFAPAEGELP